MDDKLINEIESFLEDGKKLGIKIPGHLREKINSIKEQKDDGDRIKIALIGGFSVGKTSIVGGWLHQQKSDMKIGVGESSNEVEVYYPTNEPYEIIDTPGLYGYKGDISSEGKREEYKDKTRKYISKAQVVLYVMEPENPIKDSHKEELEWLFRDLDLLPRTIFVLSQFDNVTDVDDEEDYKEDYEVKKKNVIGRLKDTIGLTDAEKANLSIVAVSAAPFSKPLSEWLNSGDLSDYDRVSHLPSLRKAVDEKIIQAGGKEKLLASSRKAMLKDVLLTPLDEAKSISKRCNYSVKEGEDRLKQEEKINKKVPQLVKDAVKDINKVLDDRLKTTISNLEGQEDAIHLNGFVATKIGRDFGIFKTVIGSIVKRRVDILNDKIFSYLNTLSYPKDLTYDAAQEISLKYDIPLSDLSTPNGNMADLFLKVARNPQIGNAIKLTAGRLLTKETAKLVGPIGVGITAVAEIMASQKEKENKQKFISLKNELSEGIRTMVNKLKDDLPTDIHKGYSTNWAIFEASFKKDSEKMKNLKRNAENVAQWEKKGDELRARLN